MSQPELDRRLLQFLDACESERELGNTNAAIRGALERLADRLGEHETGNVNDFADVRVRLDQHHFRIGNLEGRALRSEDRADRTADALPPMHRREEVSSHDWTAQLQLASKRAGDALTERVNDPTEPRFTSERARAIAREESAKLADGRILERWRWSKAWAFRMATEAVKALIILAVGYLAARLIR